MRTQVCRALPWILGPLVVTATTLGCTSTRAPAALGAGPVSVPPTRSCRAPSQVKPLLRVEQSATIATARIGERRVALVADEDAKAIVTLDLDDRTPLAETPLGAAPRQLLVTTDGRIVVTLRETNEVAVFTATEATVPLTKRCATEVANEPIALATTADASTIVVTSGWGRALTVLDAANLEPRFAVDLPREPRAIVVADDGKRAFVSHAVGSLVSVVDLGAKAAPKPLSVRGLDTRVQPNAFINESSAAAMAPRTLPSFEQTRPTCQGFALVKSAAIGGRIFAPDVVVDPGNLEGRPDGYGSDDDATETAAIAVLDEARAEAVASSLVIDDTTRRSGHPRDKRDDCLLPRAAAIDPSTKTLLVTCFGIDTVVLYDATAANPAWAERRRIPVGAGPSGVAVDPEKRRGLVWSQFDRTITTFPIGGTELADPRRVPAFAQKTTLPPLREKLAAEYALGRVLFHAAGDPRVASDGRACASCHPDGRDDAITWATPDGPRRSIMLAGRVSATAPYSWNGSESTLHAHLGNTFDRLSGKGLRNIELDALVTYLAGMPAPKPSAPRDPATRARIARGKTIFESAEAGCSGCHTGATLTDGRSHDVGSKRTADREGSFNTPSLHLVAGTGPYFHDGRYPDLAELLRKSDGTMGHTGHLGDDDRAALQAFVESL